MSGHIPYDRISKNLTEKTVLCKKYAEAAVRSVPVRAY